MSVHLQAGAREVYLDTISRNIPDIELGMLQSLEPNYLNEVLVSSVWSSNWFMSLSGGAAAFVGTPLGCEDLFGRIRPSLTISAGKWFTPEIGARISFQGLELKDANIERHNYHLYQANLLWNVSNSLRQVKYQPKWNIIPIIGLGLIHHKDNGNHPFALSYGVIGQYQLSRRIALNLELGGATTFSDFDGAGASNRMGDHLFNLSAGISFQIGKVGWKRVVDVNPYIAQNRWLIDYATSMKNNNQMLNQQCLNDASVIAELKKILDIEGLLENYSDRPVEGVDNNFYQTYPKNNYSGLNSLRARLNNKQWDGMGGLCANNDIANFITPIDSASISEYRMDILNGNIFIGAPIHFFFKIGTTNLTDESQMINLDELARVAKQHSLKITVVGAADSSTGTSSINDSLGKSRAEFILNNLIERGVEINHITSKSKGGIDNYTPTAANRNTMVYLYF